MTFLEFVYIMFLKGCLRAAKGYCFWCITLCFVLLQSCVCLGKLYFIPEKLFFIYKAIGMSGCLTHIHCMEHCKHVSWFVFSKYVFCKCIPCAFQQLEIIFYTVGHQKITFLYFGDPFLGFSTTFDKICCQTITDVIFGNKNWPKKTPPPSPIFNAVLFSSLYFALSDQIWGCWGVSRHFPRKCRKNLFQNKKQH